MARPTKSPDEKRTERLPYARLTVAERVTVEGMAAQAGLSVSDFARRAVLGQKLDPKPRRRPAPIERAGGAYLTELGRIGINLNQIARRANASGNIPDHLTDTLDALTELIDAIAGEVQP